MPYVTKTIAKERSPEWRHPIAEPPAGNGERHMEHLSLPAWQNHEAPSESTATIRKFRPYDVIANRFRIIRYVARGGMGEVYEAEDLAIRSRFHVALKIVRPGMWSDREIEARFEREAEISRTLTHPNICRVHDLGFHAARDAAGNPVEVPFLTMEFLNGCTLAARLRAHGPLQPAEALPIIRQIAAALDTMHGAGVIHGDLKPSNIMLVQAGRSSPRAVISDFGFARRLPADFENGAFTPDTELTGGTPDYMSPEQVTGGFPSPKSDIYSLGVVIYRMVTGRLPFAGRNAALRMSSRLSESPAPPRIYARTLHPDWETVILKCLAIDPVRRFASAREIASALAQSLSVPGRYECGAVPSNRHVGVLAPLVVGLAGSLLAISVLRCGLIKTP